MTRGFHMEGLCLGGERGAIVRLSWHSPGPVPCALTVLKEEKGFQATRFTPSHHFHLRAARFTHKASQTE